MAMMNENGWNAGTTLARSEGHSACALRLPIRLTSVVLVMVSTFVNHELSC